MEAYSAYNLSSVEALVRYLQAFDIEESLGCHGHEHCVSGVLFGLFGLLLRKFHCLDVFRDGVVFVVVLVHGVLES